jgi:putative membrane protein
MASWKSSVCVIGLMSLLVGSQASAQPSGASLAAADQKFLNYAAEDNQAEIQLCLVAEKRALDPALKAFARLMVDDHAGIESRLAALGNELQVDLPDGIGKEGRETASKLQPLQGREFETEFIKAQIKDHSDDLEKFSQEQKSTQNDRIRQFATETVPLLQQHLALARAVETQLGNSQTVGKGNR